MEGATQSLLYFAYGEHMNETEMKRVFPHARDVGLSRLDGYALCFVGKDGMARAALEPAPGRSILGRVWSLYESDAEDLDRIADDPYFARREVRVIPVGGMKLPALVYITAPGQARGRPSFVTYSIMQEAYEEAGEDAGAIRSLAVSCVP